MTGDLLNLLIGAIIGIIATIIGICIKYLLSIREKGISREFEMYQKGMVYLQQLYGFLSILFDLVDGYVRATEEGEAQISDYDGFVYLTPNQIISRYDKKYEQFTKFMGSGKNRGDEIFLRKDLAKEMEDVWGLAGFFYEAKNWDKELADEFDEATVKAMERIEEMIGIRRKTWLQ